MARLTNTVIPFPAGILSPAARRPRTETAA